jgi:hypothetical protein
MPSLPDALAEVRALLIGPDLIRAVAAGRRRGEHPSVVRATLRPVRLKAGERLQLVTEDGQRPTTVNLTPGKDAEARLDELLAEPFGNWHVETAGGTLQLRVTKKGDALVHWSAGGVSDAPAARTGGAGAAEVDAQDLRARAHDRPKEHLLDPGDPLYDVIGGNAAKRRQVDAFLRALVSTLGLQQAGNGSTLSMPTAAQAGPTGSAALPQPLQIVDLGCGNAYLTFAAYRYLTGLGLDVRLTGVDVRVDQRERNTALAEQLGWADRVTFVASTIADAAVEGGVDVVLALHACDTATDDALASAVHSGARWILAAPCCHKDLSQQLRRAGAPTPYRLLTEHGILRERFADVLTDAARAALLRERGYDVEVVEFIDSAHTPRNALIRARHTGRTSADPELAALLAEWNITPHLATLL